MRLVTANPSTKPFIRIIRPTELGSDGKPTEIILADGVGPEPFVDGNGNGVWDLGETFTDKNTNKVWDGPDSLDYVVQVETSLGVTNAPTITGITTTGTPSVTEGTTAKTWIYNWGITAAGNYTISAETTLNGQSTTTSRNARVIVRQTVDSSGSDSADDDNDGLVNIDESNQKALPTTSNETWTNGDVHIYYATGRSLPTCVDSDGDGLPDGLEVGWRIAGANTKTDADTNGDGIPNFCGDLDPPLYAVVENAGAVPGVGNTTQGDNRTRQAAGTVTDPAKADTDDDGLPDGLEDANRNGWTDGDGKSLPLNAPIAQYATARPNSGDWPNNIIDVYSPTSREIWTETSPTKADSDDDGLQDGYGEDKNLNGFIDGDTDNDRVYDAGEAWAETSPLNKDTDGDGLPDGWEDQFGLDPLDNGTDSYRTATAQDGVADNGAAGDPDGDGVNNADELAAGSNPRQNNTPANGGPGEGTIRIGQFADWTYNDLLVLDEYNEGGSQGADVYRSWNDTDNSRDIVAFSFRDGGATSGGGDGRVYFRIDLLDLAANAWQGEVDAYILIDTGNPAVGERATPNEVDIATEMGWEVAVAVYAPDSGAVFVDTQRNNNTDNKYQNPNSTYGVQIRGFGAPSLNRAAWSSTYDAVEISIDRQNLLDAGWLGDPNSLNFQVFTTKPYTTGTGTGDISGRNDIRDTISDDWIASDYWKDQDNIKLNEKLSYYFGRDLTQGNINGKKWNDRNKYAKVMLLAHGNQAMQPASEIQKLVRSGTPATGYSRLLQTHDSYNAPLTLHLTPTTASALQWAQSTTPTPWPNNDGPSFNAKLRSLIANGRVALLGSTFSDHIPKYFPNEFNSDNQALSMRFLDGIYGSNSASRTIFWPPERVLDTDSLQKISAMGYAYTFADQMKHFVKWFGRTAALSEGGYRINEVNGMKIFPIHDETSAYLDQTRDEGSTLPIRQLLSRRSRSSVQDQVVVLWKDLGDFTNDAKATSYDANVRWLSSRPWVRVVTAQQIAGGAISYVGQDGNTYTGWGTVNRGLGKTLAQTAKDWIDWATGGNYDNWYNGSVNETGLRNQYFGATNSFGQVGSAGHSQQAWLAVSNIPPTNSLRAQAGATFHASMFQTAFHNTPAGNQAKFSTGDYIYPDTSLNQGLADFANVSQSQARFAKIYDRVRQWNATITTTSLGKEQADVDLDGQPEYLLYNSRIFALFEAKGGRMTAAWIRNPSSQQVWQVAGNFAAFGGNANEDEGPSNFVGTTTTLSAYRTSGFKDWWSITGANGSNSTVNATYAVSSAPDGTGWTFSQGGITKTITLANPWTGNLSAAYSLTGPNQLYVRFGLSPNLMDLMINGQTHLSQSSSANRFTLANGSPGDSPIRAFVMSSGNSLINTNANDAGGANFTTVNLRNQAQTQQVEVQVTGNATLIFGFDQGTDLTAPPADSDGDGIPDWWENQYNLGDLASMDATTDGDKDGLLDLDEFILGSNPNDPASGRPAPVLTNVPGSGFTVSFQTMTGRTYQVVGSDDLTLPSTSWPIIGAPVQGDGTVKSVTDSSATASTRKFYKIYIFVSP